MGNRPLRFVAHFALVIVFAQQAVADDKAQKIKESHRKILRVLYGGICSAHEELGKLVVNQAGELSRFAGSVVASRDWQSKAAGSGKSGSDKTATAKKKAPARKPSAKAAPAKDA